jgi:ribosomal protein S18 acetylase RimI-like enzyme
MSTKTEPDFDVLRAPPALRREALEMVLQDVPEGRRSEYIDRLLASAQARELDLDGLLVARQGDGLVGAIWGYLQPGHVASLWPPVVLDSDGDAASDALLSHLATWLANGGTEIAQALLPVDGARQTAQMVRQGFTHMADLLYMVCLASHFPNSEPQSPLAFEAASAAADARLTGVVERTYERTLDCPQLNGVRDVRDVLAGYRACGTFDPSRWLIARDGEQDVGCLLLTDEPADDQWEIVYAGLVPAARGHGYGLSMARHAQWLARCAGRARLVLAVDAANVPAVKMYERAGFVVWDRRRALIRIFPRGGAAPVAN